MSDLSEMDFDPNEYLVSDSDSPFFGLPAGYTNPPPDPDIVTNEAVLDRLGLESFGDIVINVNETAIERLRGNRFTSFIDAIVYLYEAGILSISDVTLDEEGEVGVAIDEDTQRSRKKR